MAKLTELHDFPDSEDSPTWEEGMRAEEERLDQLLAASNDLPDGEIVGAVITFPRGDGKAFYLVEKASPLTLAWIPFGDRWSVEDALIRGLRKNDVVELVRRERAIASLFGGRS